MAPVIRISDRNWERLKKWAVPLEDSADDALGKALVAAEAQRNGKISHLPISNHHGNTLGSVPKETAREEAADTPQHANGGMDSPFPSDCRPEAEDNGLFTERFLGDDEVGPQRILKRQKTPQQAYEFPILESLYELGGKAATSIVLDRVEVRMTHLLSDVDYQPLKSGALRWRNTAQWARNTLVEGGLLKNESWGIWELTEQGITEVELKKG